MILTQHLKNWLKCIVSRNFLTLSGEIIIGSVDVTMMVSSDSSIFTKISADASLFQQQYPYIRVRVEEGLHEITIKLFACKKRFLQEHFYDQLRDELVGLISNILNDKRLMARLNVYGTIDSFKKIDNFRYLNKATEVSYKITNSEHKLPFYKQIFVKT